MTHTPTTTNGSNSIGDGGSSVSQNHETASLLRNILNQAPPSNRDESSLLMAPSFGLTRASSAPPVISDPVSFGGGSSGSNMSSLDFSSLIPDESEKYRAHPEYAQYYYENRLFNPRLAPPLRDWNLMVDHRSSKSNSQNNSLFPSRESVDSPTPSSSSSTDSPQKQSTSSTDIWANSSSDSTSERGSRYTSFSSDFKHNFSPVFADKQNNFSQQDSSTKSSSHFSGSRNDSTSDSSFQRDSQQNGISQQMQNLSLNHQQKSNSAHGSSFYNPSQQSAYPTYNDQIMSTHHHHAAYRAETQMAPHGYPPQNNMSAPPYPPMQNIAMGANYPNHHHHGAYRGEPQYAPDHLHKDSPQQSYNSPYMVDPRGGMGIVPPHHAGWNATGATPMMDMNSHHHPNASMHHHMTTPSSGAPSAGNGGSSGSGVVPSPTHYAHTQSAPHHHMTSTSHHGTMPSRVNKPQRKNQRNNYKKSNAYSSNQDNQTRSKLMDEFKKGSKNIELRDICGGHVVEFSRDQHGSRFIQQKLKDATLADKEAVFKEIEPEALSLMTDVFGNYVIQKFFEHGTKKHRKMLANKLRDNVLKLTLQTYGCRVIQKALDVIDEDDQQIIAKELEKHVIQCVSDQNGNHVIQKCIEGMPPKMVQFIVDSFKGQIHQQSRHAYGCRVIQRMLEHCSDEQTKPLLDEIMQCVRKLVVDQYGNYVVQHVLQHGKPQHKSAIIDKLKSDFVKYSTDKYASNVIEKCYQYGSKEQQNACIDEICAKSKNGEELPLFVMMKDQFANFVVQRIIEWSDDNQRQRITNSVRPHITTIKRMTFGKHILTCLSTYSKEIERLTSNLSPT